MSVPDKGGGGALRGGATAVHLHPGAAVGIQLPAHREGRADWQVKLRALQTNRFSIIEEKKIFNN